VVLSPARSGVPPRRWRPALLLRTAPCCAASPYLGRREKCQFLPATISPLRPPSHRAAWEAHRTRTCNAAKETPTPEPPEGQRNAGTWDRGWDWEGITLPQKQRLCSWPNVQPPHRPRQEPYPNRLLLL